MIYSYRFHNSVFWCLAIFLLIPISYLLENEKVRQMEEAILDYYKYTNGFIWKWNLEEVKLASIPGTSESVKYGALCRHGSTLTKIKDPVVMDIVLASQNCAQVPMEVLECTCTEIKVFKNDAKVITNWDLDLLRGPNGEIYRTASLMKTECQDKKVVDVIIRCIHDGNSFMTDVSEIENLFLDGSNRPKWDSPELTCQLLHPDTSKMELDVMHVTFESKKSVEVPMLVLKCISKRNDTTDGSLHEDSYAYVKDSYNTVYKVENSDIRTKCNKPEGLTIRKRVIDSHNRLVQPVCPM